jgi:hypothetical protein
VVCLESGTSGPRIEVVAAYVSALNAGNKDRVCERRGSVNVSYGSMRVISSLRQELPLCIQLWTYRCVATNDVQGHKETLRLTSSASASNLSGMSAASLDYLVRALRRRHRQGLVAEKR